MSFARRVAILEGRLGRLPSVLVALSGGVDSATLLGIAVRAVPGRVLAATTRSEAVPAEEVAEAAVVARGFGVGHVVLDTGELDDPRYRRNGGDRCYFCRVGMYDALLVAARREGIAHVADGLQADDRADDRPGVRAARERGVLHPLRDAGLGKADVRRLARALGLACHDKPAQPCLASRLPHGVEVTGDRLRLVHRAESALRALGLREVRVRCERSHGRIEVGPRELPLALERSADLRAAVVAAGFETAAVDPLGYRGG
jgi:uncharacterized protein